MVGITTWVLQVVNSVCQDLCIDFCKLLAHFICHGQIPSVCTLQIPLQFSSCEIRVWVLTSDPTMLGLSFPTRGTGGSRETFPGGVVLSWRRGNVVNV